MTLTRKIFRWLWLDSDSRGLWLWLDSDSRGLWLWLDSDSWGLWLWLDSDSTKITRTHHCQLLNLSKV